MPPEIVVEDTGFNEGPCWRPDGTITIVGCDRGVVYRIWPEEQRKEVFGDTGGGPNATALAADGGALVTQAGGHDLTSLAPDSPSAWLGAPKHYQVPEEPRWGPAGLQYVSPEGSVSYLLEELQAPNDLVVAENGTIYFTDPPSHGQMGEALGRVWAYRTNGSLRLVADGFEYCNGILLEPNGGILVVEGPLMGPVGLQRVSLDGEKDWLIEDLGEGGGDGMCVDVEGRLYVCARWAHLVRVIEDGVVVDELAIPGPGLVTNCCFGGADNRTLFATDACAGTVVAWEGMTTPGLPLHAWPGVADVEKLGS
jgi:sugar lactone lactonase YvrE